MIHCQSQSRARGQPLKDLFSACKFCNIFQPVLDKNKIIQRAGRMKGGYRNVTEDVSVINLRCRGALQVNEARTWGLGSEVNSSKTFPLRLSLHQLPKTDIVSAYFCHLYVNGEMMSCNSWGISTVQFVGLFKYSCYCKYSVIFR